MPYFVDLAKSTLANQLELLEFCLIPSPCAHLLNFGSLLVLLDLHGRKIRLFD